MRLPAGVAVLACAVLGGASAVAGPAEVGAARAAALERALSAAETSLKRGQAAAAEIQYRSALREAWLMLAALDAADARIHDARHALRQAGAEATEDREAIQALALAHLQLGDGADAVRLLGPLAEAQPKDAQVRRLLAQALVDAGQTERAVRLLEDARLAAPGDLELAYLLATGYLRMKRIDDADGLFAQVARARPIAPTHVLIGGAYADAGEYARARRELEKALKQDPKVRRAHYYLGQVALQETGPGLDSQERAIAEFQAELALAPGDVMTSIQLGMTLATARRPEEALPHLQHAAAAERPEARAYYYLGRCQLALDRAADAAASSRRALELAQEQRASDARLASIHYQLGQALRQQGKADEAGVHFAEAERLTGRNLDASREQLSRYMADAAEPSRPPGVATDGAGLSGLPAAERSELRRKLKAALARSYLNLGVMHAQARRFEQAAERFEQAAAVDPDFPQVQYSLGVAYFSLQQFAKAVGPLGRALPGMPEDAGLRRMLAMASLNTEAYARAAELLAGDPEREHDPSLQFAYGMALVRSDRAAEAEAVFSRLLAQHGDSAEVNVMLGHAHAKQDDYEAAVSSLRRALRIKPDVADAHAALGVIYLRQGKLPEAERAFRSELEAHPGDLASQQKLALVLDLQQRPEEALPLLRHVVAAAPDATDARYLLGKILLANGATAEALEHLERAARLSPDDANVRYQLGRAYQTLGRTESAEREFEAFRQIKTKR